MFLFPALVCADSAQMDINPISRDWNAAANWTRMTVPNGPADCDICPFEHETDVSISEKTESVTS
jgi:hypothetical protein